LWFKIQENPSTPFILEPDLIEIIPTLFTSYSDLTRYLSVFCALISGFFP
jgi:hypothetical protein